MTLPESKQSRTGISPLRARVMLAGTPKVGKSTLLAAWAPETTLIIDTQGGTHLLEGEHFVAPVTSWAEFEHLVTELTTTEHQFKTVGIDLVDDLWNFCDVAFAGRGQVLASATDDWQRSIKTAQGMFRQWVGRLLVADLGVWFVGHVREKQDGNTMIYAPALDSKVEGYVKGACDFVLLAEALGPRRVLHTAPSAKFEAGSRVPLPEPMDLDARGLYAAMNSALNPAKGSKSKAPVEVEREAVTA